MLSIAVSILLIKNDATEFTLLILFGATSFNIFKPEMYDFAALMYLPLPNNNVTLTLMPKLINLVITGMPASVPGTLIITLGLLIKLLSINPSFMLSSVLFANFGSISMLTNPSFPSVFSYTSIRTSQADDISSIDIF